MGDKRPFVRIKIQDQEEEWLIDTGAAISVVDENLIPQGISSVQKVRQAPPITSASGHRLPVRGIYKVPLWIGNRCFPQEVAILAKLEAGAILGVDFLQKHQAVIDLGKKALMVPSVAGAEPAALATITMSQRFKTPVLPEVFQLYCVKDQVIPPMSEKLIRVSHNNQEETRAGVVLGPGIVEAVINLNPGETSAISFRNETAKEITMHRKEKIAIATILTEELMEVRPMKRTTTAPSFACTRDKEKYLREKIDLKHLKEAERRALWNLILRNHDAFSGSKMDLGHATAVKHRIRLTDNRPVHVKQFRIPWAHTEFVNEYVEDLVKKGCIEPSTSSFNAPCFCVPKGPEGKKLRLVLDFRKLNEKTIEDKYIIREVQDCIDEVGRNGSRVFSSLDLTAGFYQQEVEVGSRHMTAFTLPGRGRFQFKRLPMGLRGSPASFSKLMSRVLEGNPEGGGQGNQPQGPPKGLIVYLDDILAHAATFEDHLKVLEECFRRLRAFNLKLNPEKCQFMTKEVPYLGFLLTPDGIKPSKTKAKAVKEFPEPRTVRQVREFLGLTNYFRRLIQGYAMKAGKLTRLLTKESGWPGGALPPDARESFEILKKNLCEAPILGYPSPNREFIVTTDASTGSADQKEPGGVGAVLSQIDPEKGEVIIDYASRSLRPFEKNYSAFMLEAAAASWGLDHWYVYLYNAPKITLYCDHKPLEKLTSRQTKTLNRLQDQMMRFNFTIKYKEGKENTVADSLSRNPVDAIMRNPISELRSLGLSNSDLKKLQASDKFCTVMRKYLEERKLPEEKKMSVYIQKEAGKCFIKDDLLFYQLQKRGRIPKPVMILPKDLRGIVFDAFHTHIFAGHSGAEKTTWKIQECYWYPYMMNDIIDRVNNCLSCAMSKRPTQYRKRHAPCATYKIPDRPNQQVHIDLFGPLKTSESGKKFILVITDQFSKLATIAGLPNKEAETVARAIFERYICRFSVPEKIITDNGTEFCARISEELFKLLGVKHIKTAVYRPQSNTYAEVFNKEIQKYLRTIMEDGNTLDWEKYLAPLELSYNTGVHSAALHSPFYLTFLHEPRLPYYDAGKEKTLYTDDYATDCLARLRATYRLVASNLEESNRVNQIQRNKGAKHVSFNVGQSILVAFPFKELKDGKKQNRKLTRPYSDGFRVEEKIGEYTYVIKNVTNGRRHTVHADLLRERPSKESAAPEESAVENSAISKQTEVREKHKDRGVQAETCITWKSDPRPTTARPTEAEDVGNDETASQYSSSNSAETYENDAQSLPSASDEETVEGAGTANFEVPKKIPVPSPRRTRSQGPAEEHPWIPWFPPGARRWFQE